MEESEIMSSGTKNSEKYNITFILKIKNLKHTSCSKSSINAVCFIK